MPLASPRLPLVSPRFYLAVYLHPREMLKSTSICAFITLILATLASAYPLLNIPNIPNNANDVEGGEEPRAALATVYSNCKNSKQVALTFDDGPWVYAYVFNLFCTILSPPSRPLFLEFIIIVLLLNVCCLIECETCVVRPSRVSRVN